MASSTSNTRRWLKAANKRASMAAQFDLMQHVTCAQANSARRSQVRRP
jgi:hypothetical protein